MGWDFEIEKGVLFGEWLNQQFKAEVHFEEERSWMDRLSRIEARLEEGRDGGKRL